MWEVLYNDVDRFITPILWVWKLFIKRNMNYLKDIEADKIFKGHTLLRIQQLQKRLEEGENTLKDQSSSDVHRSAQKDDEEEEDLNLVP